MKGTDRYELNVAALTCHALIMAVLDGMDEETRKKIYARAMGYLPPAPRPEEFPVDHMFWIEARKRLETQSA